MKEKTGLGNPEASVSVLDDLHAAIDRGIAEYDGSSPCGKDARQRSYVLYMIRS